MARREVAQILIQIRGGIKAAAESRAAAGGVKELRQELTKATGAALMAKLALGGFAISALPLVGSAAGAAVVSVLALTAAVGGLAVGIGVMAGAAVLHFKATADEADSAAARVKQQARLLKGAFADATAAGSEKVLEGVVPILRGARQLAKELKPAFTQLGGAMKSAMTWFGQGLRELAPEFSAMLKAVGPAMKPLAEFLLAFLSLFARVATEAMPYLIRGLEWMADGMRKLQRAVTDGAIDRAFDRMGAAVSAIGDLLGGVRDTLGPELAGASAEFADAFKGSARAIGRNIGSLAAGLAQIGRGALPGITKAIDKIGPALEMIIDSGALTTLGKVFGDVFGVIADVIGTVVDGLNEAGLLAPAIYVLVGAIVAWKVAMFALNVVMAANPIGLVLVGIYALSVGLVVAYQKVEWFREAVDATWSWIKDNWPLIAGMLGGPIGVAGVLIARHWDKITDGARDAYTAVKKWLGDAVSFMVGLHVDVLSAAAGIGKAIVEGIVEGIKSAPGAISDALMDLLPGPVKEAAGGIFSVVTAPARAAVSGVKKVAGGRATGGVTQSAGWGWVGERGPELMWSEPGDQVVDHRTSAQITKRGPAGLGELGGDGGGGYLPVTFNALLDGEVLFRAVERVKLRREAVA